jgi:hypothetical protein
MLMPFTGCGKVMGLGNAKSVDEVNNPVPVGVKEQWHWKECITGACVL